MTKDELEQLKALVEKAQKVLENEKPPEFLPGDIVEGSDTEEDWGLDRFIKFKDAHSFPYVCHQNVYKYCRKPRCSNIRIRHDGKGIPEWVKGKRVIIEFRNGKSQKDIIGTYNYSGCWTHANGPDDIMFYTIIEDWPK